MAIQTAGEQKYYDFIEERAKSLRTGMIIWISFLAAALIAVFNSPVIGAALTVAGVLLAVLNVRNQRALRAKLSGIEDKAGFFNQLIAPDAVEIPAFRLLVTREFVLSFLTDVFIYRLSDMDKVEVGLGRGAEKVLFLTDRSGERYEIARSERREDPDFDRACGAVRERLGAAKKQKCMK